MAAIAAISGMMVNWATNPSKIVAGFTSLKSSTDRVLPIATIVVHRAASMRGPSNHASIGGRARPSNAEVATHSGNKFVTFAMIDFVVIEEGMLLGGSVLPAASLRGAIR